MTALITLADARTWLRYPNPTQASADDNALQTVIDAVTQVVEFHAAIMVPKVYTETYDGGSCSIWLRHTPVISVASVQDNAGFITFDLALQNITAVTVGSTGSEGGATASSIWAFSLDDPKTGQLTKRTIANSPLPFSGGVRNVTATYTAGQQTMPPAAVLAAKELLAHLWQNSQLRAMANTAGNAEYDSTYGAHFTHEDPNGPSLWTAVPNRVIQLLESCRERLPSIA
jgi:hypothetical protein